MPDILDWKLLGEVTIDADSKDFTLAETGVDLGGGAGVAVPLSLTTGTYADVRVLCNDAGAYDLKSLLDGAGGQSYSVAPSDSTGRVTITAGGGNNFAIVWTDTDLRDMLGFTGNISGATTQTGTNVHANGFYPEQAAWWREVDSSELVEAVMVPDAGGMVADHFYERISGLLEYRFVVDDEEALLRNLWDNLIKQRLSFNFYPDRTVNSAYNVSSMRTGYRRWKLHESVKGWTAPWPHRPWSKRRHLKWPLRHDTEDSDFQAVGT